MKFGENASCKVGEIHRMKCRPALQANLPCIPLTLLAQNNVLTHALTDLF